MTVALAIRCRDPAPTGILRRESPDVWPGGLVRGGLGAEIGDGVSAIVDGANAGVRLAGDPDGQDLPPRVFFNLAVRSQESGEAAAARAGYRTTIDSQHPEWAPIAAGNLGLMLVREGDAAGARAAHQVAIDSGHP
jgi:hypothetical protein